MPLSLNICAFCTFYIFIIKQTYGHYHSEKLLLVSFDGFRYDYLDMVKEKGKQTPHFDSLIEGGVKAKDGMKNMFVTKTFPNHYSLATGMYEENHGVVGNVMYDTRWNETFDKNDPKTATQTKWWSNGTSGANGPEPIWITNQKGDQTVFKRRSGVMFWPGSEVRIRGMRPSIYMNYTSSYPNHARIDNIVSWFSRKEDPINLGLLYFSEPDHLGHNVGPEDPAMIDMIVALDGLVGYLIDKLKETKLFHQLNIIITSDHGMVQIDNGNIIDLSKHMTPLEEFIEVEAGGSPGLNIIPKPGMLEEVYQKLKAIPHISVYKKSEVPRELHYQRNTRILDLVVIADPGWNVYMNATAQDWGERGNHGYNNLVTKMHPFFIAHGPVFKKNFVSTDMFNTIDVYPLMCHILGLQPGPFDGSLANIEHILDTEHSLLTITLLTFLLSVIFAATIACIFCVAACRTYRLSKHHRRFNNLNLGHTMIDGKTRLLSTDDEEFA